MSDPPARRPRPSPEARPPLVVSGRVVRGHGVAGGGSTASPYDAGTIPLQIPFFRDRGLDLGSFHPATINVSTAPVRVVVTRPAHHLAQVPWTPLHAPESFDFVRVTVVVDAARFDGWGYRPTADTKAGHWQDPTVLEVIAPFIEGIAYGRAVVLELRPEEVSLEPETDTPD